MNHETEVCTHHDEQHHVDIVGPAKIPDDAQWPCDWCGDRGVVTVLVKSKRHHLKLCRECDEVISILAGSEGNV